MPVIIKSKSQRAFELSFTSRSTKPHYSSTSTTRIVGDSFDARTLRNSTQHSDAFTKAGGTKRARPSPQKPQKQSRKHSVSNETKSLQKVAELTSFDHVNHAIMHWPCRFCSCPKGAFIYSINACTRCGHEMDDHEEYHHLWNLDCDFVCERQDLVAFILQLVRNTRVVIIRATPLVGKSTLLRLLGRHILDTQRDLESILIH